MLRTRRTAGRQMAVALGLLAICAASGLRAQEVVGERFARPLCTNGEPVAPEVQAGNADLVRSFVEEGLGRGDMVAFDRYVAPDVWVSTGLKPGAPIEGRDEYKAVVASTLGAALAPETASLDIEEVLPTLDGRVLVRFTARADHTGEILGVPATDRRLTLSEIHLFCVRNGLIVENYVGALNPLQWEMIYADSITAEVLP